MSEPSILIVGPDTRNTGGRPRVYGDKVSMSSVSTWIWSQHHDALVKMANQRKMSVSELVRDILTKSIRTP